jgi:hypothetical protein
MRFRDIYFAEEKLGVGDTVYISNDKVEYIIKDIKDDDVYELVDAKTKKKTKLANPKDLHAKQLDLFGGKSSTEPPKKKSYKRPKKLGKPEDTEQLSLF